MAVNLPEGILHKLVEQALAGIYVIHKGKLSYVNQHFVDLFGFSSPSQLIGNIDFLDLIHPDDRDKVAANIKLRELGIVEQVRYAFRGISQDQRIIHLEVHGHKIDHEGQPALLGVVVDQTAYISAQQQLKQQQHNISALMESDLIGIICWDAEGYIRYANSAFKSFLGLSDKQIEEGLHWHTITPGEYFYTCLEHIEQINQTGSGSALQKEFFHQDGHRVPALVNGAKLDDGGENIGVSFILDLSEKKELEAVAESEKSLRQQVEKRANKDPLTRLHNRAVLEMRVAQLISQSHREATEFTLGFLDLDNFKIINDTLGHAAGDQALQAVAESLSAALQQVDALARFGGDEFVALVNGPVSSVELNQIEQQIHHAIQVLNLSEGLGEPVSCSLGWATFPDDGSTLDDLLHQADQRMYQHKNAKKRSA